jgi:protein-L-isoaspartate(D-aspartate) O-methyltransferase
MYKPMVALAAAATITMAACAPDLPIPTPASELTSLPAAYPTSQATAPFRLEGSLAGTEERDPFADARDRMVDFQIADRGVLRGDVLAAMRAVPRHEFVLDEYLDQAYADHPLPIGYGQTISQPYIVALMTEKSGIKRGDRVLDVGSGSGYQAAVAAELGAEVYSIEIIPELAQSADERLRRLGYAGVVTQGDGYYGWEAHAPFDAIIVAAAPDHVPQPLVRQLKDGGRLVIPVGPQGSYQTLWLFTRQGDELEAENLGGVAFVPLTGER